MESSVTGQFPITGLPYSTKSVRQGGIQFNWTIPKYRSFDKTYEHIEEIPKVKIEEKNIELELEHIEETHKFEVKEKDIEHDHQDTKEIKKES